MILITRLLLLIYLLIFCKGAELSNFEAARKSQSPIVCPQEIFEKGLSIEVLGDKLPLFGKEWYTIESLFQNGFEEKFRDSAAHNCLADDFELDKDLSCYQNVRSAFKDKTLGKENNQTDKLIFKMRSEPDSNHTMLSRFYYALCLVTCTIRSKDEESAERISYEICPDPCSHQESCSQTMCTTTGIFSHEYECKCNNDWKWSYDTLTCIPKYLDRKRQNLDSDPSSLELFARTPKYCDLHAGCHPNNTLWCNIDKEMNYTVCVCKSYTEGAKCDRYVDACKSRIKHPFQPNGGTIIAGNRACNVNFPGNKCQSVISSEGYVSYSCECENNNWGPDASFPYPNCLSKRTLCSSAICVHGQCVSSDNGKKIYCICNRGWAGNACDEWVGEWSEWSPWDKCRPSCGDVRYSVRGRDCISMSVKNNPRECFGSSIEYVKCAEHQCTGSEGTYLETYFAVRQNAIATSLSYAGIVSTLLVLSWLYLCWGALSGTFAPNIRVLWQRLVNSR